MAVSKEIQITQAIIDQDEFQINNLLKDKNVSEWISHKVHTSSLSNHNLIDEIIWTTAMCRACEFSNLTTMQKLSRAGAHLYNIDSDGNNALTNTCMFDINTLEKVKFLLGEDKTLLNETDDKANTALHNASTTGQTDVCEYLLQKGANVNAKNIERVTSLGAAARANKADVITLLYQRGAILQKRSNLNMNPLHEAAIEESFNALKLLLDLGADLHTRGWQQRSALHNAVQSGSVECTSELINRGVPVDVRDESNSTPLHIAAIADKSKCIKE